MLKDERRRNENEEGTLRVKRKYVTRSSDMKNGRNWYINTNKTKRYNCSNDVVIKTNFKEHEEQRIDSIDSNNRLSEHCDPKNQLHPVTKIKSPIFKYSKCRTCRIPCSGEVFKIRKFNLNIEKIDSTKYNGKRCIKSVATAVQDKFVVRDVNLPSSVSTNGIIANSCNSKVLLPDKSVSDPHESAGLKKLVNGIHNDSKGVSLTDLYDDHNTFNSSYNKSPYLNVEDKSVKDISGNNGSTGFLDKSAANLIGKPARSQGLEVALDLANGDIHHQNNHMQSAEDKVVKIAEGKSVDNVSDLRKDQFDCENSISNDENSISNDENLFSMVLRSRKSSINVNNYEDNKLNGVHGAVGTINSSEFGIHNKKIHLLRNTSCSSSSLNTDESCETEVEDNISISDEDVAAMKYRNDKNNADGIKDENYATRRIMKPNSYDEDNKKYSSLKNSKNMKCVERQNCQCGDNLLHRPNCNTDLSRNIKMDECREHNFIHNRKHVRLKDEDEDYCNSSSLYLHDNESFRCYILESTRRLKFLHNTFYTSQVKHDKDIFEAMLNDIEVDIKICDEDSKTFDKDKGTHFDDKQEVCITKNEHACQCQWEDCNEKFMSSMKLLDHLKSSHIDGMPNDAVFCCLWRNCKFSNQPSSYKWLSNHILKHCALRPFKCVIGGCELSFATQNGLARHVPSHFNEGKVRRTCVTTGVGKGQENGRRPKLDTITNSADNSEENDEVNEQVRKKTKFEKFVDRYKASYSVDKGSKSHCCVKYKLQISTCNSTLNCGYIGKDFRFNHKVIGRRTSKDGSTEMLLTPSSTDIFPYQSFWIDEETVKQKSLHVDLSVNDLSNDVKQLIYDNELISRFKTRESRGV